MIISNQLLQESLATLDMESLATWGEEELKSFYRAAANTAHPDKGGTPERWAAVDKANCVLKEHLRKLGGPAAPAPAVATPCPACEGRGYVTSKAQRGFKITELRRQCRRCNGTGEDGVEHDKGDWG